MSTSAKIRQAVCVLVGLVCAVQIICFAAHDFSKEISIWQEVAEEIEKELDANNRILSNEKLLQTPKLKWIYGTQDPSIFWEMVHQDGHYFIQYAGFKFLMDSGHESAVDAATYLCLDPKIPTLYTNDAVNYLFADSSRFPRMLDFILDYSKIHPDSTDHWVLIFYMIPIANVEVAYRDGKFEQISANYKVWALDRLLDEGDESLVDQLKDDLKFYRYLPGAPRLVYAYYASDQVEGLDNLIVDILQDQNLSKGLQLVLVARKKAYIQKNIDWKVLQLSDDIQKLLDTNTSENEETETGTQLVLPGAR